METIELNVRVHTSFGEKIIVTGNSTKLGEWNPLDGGIPLTTTPDTYPLWTTGPIQYSALVASGELLEYKYVRVCQKSQVHWETNGDNRRLPAALVADATRCPFSMVVDDGDFGLVPCEGFAFAKGSRGPPSDLLSSTASESGYQCVLVLGDAVAAGKGAWLWDGWASQLLRDLSRTYSYSYVNVASVGLTTSKALEDFHTLVAQHKPSVVVLSFSEELHQIVQYSKEAWEGACELYTQTLDSLIQNIWKIEAVPIIGGAYPHANFKEEHVKRLEQITRGACNLTVLDWFSELVDGDGGGAWSQSLSFTAECPNTEGHSKIRASIKDTLFDPVRIREQIQRLAFHHDEEVVCFSDGMGFEVRFQYSQEALIVSNKTQNTYGLSKSWAALQDGLAKTKQKAPWLMPRGIYAAPFSEVPFAAFVGANGALEADATVPPAANILMRCITQVVDQASDSNEVVYWDTNIGIFHATGSDSFMILNAAKCEYNVHPMWKEVRLAMKKLPQAVYEDGSGSSFRTAVISVHGLQSRVKVPAQSAVIMKRKCPLDAIPRVALLPLGDRCTIRMLLHKIEFDGPCFPFDLTRTTKLADVADMIGTGFVDMWNPDQLRFDPKEGRIYHRKWDGLSFAHEVEDGENAITNIRPIVGRMYERYSGRAARFDYACRHADRVMFLRTGCASRAEVEDLLCRISSRFPGLHAELLLISNQPTAEFAGMLGVHHVREHFDPDRMPQDMDYWINCAHRFRGILESQGIGSGNLYWCPNNLKEAESENMEAQLSGKPQGAPKAHIEKKEAQVEAQPSGAQRGAPEADREEIEAQAAEQLPGKQTDTPKADREEIEAQAAEQLPGKQTDTPKAHIEKKEAQVEAQPSGAQRGAPEAHIEKKEAQVEAQPSGAQRGAPEADREEIEAQAAEQLPGKQTDTPKADREEIEAQAAVQLPGKQSDTPKADREKIEAQAAVQLPGKQTDAPKADREEIEAQAAVQLPGKQTDAPKDSDTSPTSPACSSLSSSSSSSPSSSPHVSYRQAERENIEVQGAVQLACKQMGTPKSLTATSTQTPAEWVEWDTKVERTWRVPGFGLGRWLPA